MRRLTWENVKFDLHVIEIKASQAKTANRRLVPILLNLDRWLAPCRGFKRPIPTWRGSRPSSLAKFHLTRRHQQFLEEAEYRTSGIYPLMCKADLGPFLASFRPVGQDAFSTVVLYRRLGQPDFTERETRIAHVVLTEIPGLHEQGLPEVRGATMPRLPPRARLVLNMLP